MTCIVKAGFNYGEMLSPSLKTNLSPSLGLRLDGLKRRGSVRALAGKVLPLRQGLSQQ